MPDIMNSLWIGKEFSELEMLTLHSFLHHGHPLRLWMYEKPKHALPDGVEIANANEIIPREKIFEYPVDGPLGAKKAGVVGFSEIFRYKLLFDHGGWWVDMDVTCLKPFDFKEEYFFRNHWKFKVVCNVMKCPKNSELMKNCYERSLETVTSENNDWHKAISIMNDEVERLNLMKYRHLGLFNTDQAEFLDLYFKEPSPFPIDWIGVHWCKTALQLQYTGRSTFNNLLKKYGIAPRSISAL